MAVTLNRSEAYKLLEDASTFGFTLLAIALHTLKEDLFTEDFIEVLARLKEEFGGAELSENGENRLQAMIQVMTSLDYMEDPGLFDSVCKALATGDPDIGTPDFSPLNVAELLWAVYEINLTSDKEVPMGPHVKNYVAKIQDFHPDDEGESVLDSIEEALEDRRERLKDQLTKAGFNTDNLPELNL